MLAIQLSAEIEARLEALANATGRTKSFKVLDDLENVYLAERRLEDFRTGRDRASREITKRYE